MHPTVPPASEKRITQISLQKQNYQKFLSRQIFIDKI